MSFWFIFFNVTKIPPFPVSRVPWTSSDVSKTHGAQKPGDRPWKMFFWKGTMPAGLLWTMTLSYHLSGSQQSRPGLCLTRIKEGMSSDGDTQLVEAWGCKTRVCVTFSGKL